MSKTLRFLVLILSCFMTLQSQAQPFKRRWVDSVYNALNDQERIGQLFMVAAYSGGKNFNQDLIDKLIADRQIGGVIFMQGTPEEQVRLTNRYQKNAQVHLLIGMDAEWGLGMRLTGVKNFPRQMMIGATRDTALMYEMGTAVAAQCRRLGVHVDFAPDVDVNNNPKNPVINFRSFGEDKTWVANLGLAYMRGLQDHDVMACAKHFPGHGDVSVDSHLDMPVINKTRAQLEETEFYPFRKLIEGGVQGAMIAHLSVPALDDTKNQPTTLSKKVVTDLLKKEMGFNGLVFTDALNMSGLTKYYPAGEADLRAFMAGNDVLLFSQNVPLAIEKIAWALKTGKIAPEMLEASVKKVLNAKYDAGLYHFQSLKAANATADLNKDIDLIREKTTRAGITLVRDQQKLIPKIKAGSKLAYININGTDSTHLKAALKKKFADIQVMRLPAKVTAATVKQVVSSADKYDAVIVGIHDLAWYPGKTGTYGLDTQQVNGLKELSKKKQVIFAVFGNAYLVKYICTAKAAIVTYEDDKFAEQAVFDVLTGTLTPGGRLPVKPCK
ncbi:glycoside hydrolase family 3 protein [Taibaiella chishuiensis]|uniref:beta-N-acetylhexosaminidase n=1 Tax=Taibaiella chishuiensis TaxID=1434707 RepID=A0A2P8CX29_9BACT|nr:glycoside hydrolase family 3 N-terminal domain-containing protein [Taibaiella chishuiensis]PSK89487.1 beta-glucosidase-like glycosyl hydrolase [Taibaiella chishuiensis]